MQSDAIYSFFIYYFDKYNYFSKYSYVKPDELKLIFILLLLAGVLIKDDGWILLSVAVDKETEDDEGGGAFIDLRNFGVYCYGCSEAVLFVRSYYKDS